MPLKQPTKSKGVVAPLPECLAVLGAWRVFSPTNNAARESR